MPACLCACARIIVGVGVGVGFCARVAQPGKSAGSKSGGSAVLDKPEVLSSPQEADKIAKDKMYHVLLFNDVSCTSLFDGCMYQFKRM